MFSYLSWKQGVKKVFRTSKTLAGDRNSNITLNPEFIDRKKWSLEKLLKLDGGTTQMASAVLLLDENPPSIDRLNLTKHQEYFLTLTIQERKYWEEKQSRGEQWHLVYDETIERQAQAFLSWNERMEQIFEARQAEDYCFARAFRLITPEEGRSLSSSLAGHETNRFLEMERAIQKYESDNIIDSPDHRVVQAMVMLAKIDGRQPIVTNKNAVEKTWPQFWKFIDYAKNFSS